MNTSELGQQRPALLTPGEVAQLFRVDPKTVTRWAKAGRLHCIRTPGGHTRFFEEQVMALLAKQSTRPAAPTTGDVQYDPRTAAANNRGGR